MAEVAVAAEAVSYYRHLVSLPYEPVEGDSPWDVVEHNPSAEHSEIGQVVVVEEDKSVLCPSKKDKLKVILFVVDSDSSIHD